VNNRKNYDVLLVDAIENAVREAVNHGSPYIAMHRLIQQRVLFDALDDRFYLETNSRPSPMSRFSYHFAACRRSRLA
jgi:hypothetical protein